MTDRRQTPSARHTTVRGEALRETVEVQQLLFITIIARNEESDQLTTGGHSFSVYARKRATGKGDRPRHQAILVKDTNDGIYSASFKFTQPGKYDVGITLNGEHVAASPYPVEARVFAFKQLASLELVGGVEKTKTRSSSSSSANIQSSGLNSASSSARATKAPPLLSSVSRTSKSSKSSRSSRSSKRPSLSRNASANGSSLTPSTSSGGLGDSVKIRLSEADASSSTTGAPRARKVSTSSSSSRTSTPSNSSSPSPSLSGSLASATYSFLSSTPPMTSLSVLKSKSKSKSKSRDSSPIYSAVKSRIPRSRGNSTSSNNSASGSARTAKAPMRSKSPRALLSSSAGKGSTPPIGAQPSSTLGGGGSGHVGRGRRRSTITDDGISIQNIDIHQEASKETQSRVIATTRYIRQYYVELFTYLYTRRQRYENFLLNLRASKGEMNEEQKEELKAQYFQTESVHLRKRRARMSIARDFRLLALIGKGGYGEVFLCRKTDTFEVLALKRMKKQFLLERNQVGHVQTERNVLAGPPSPWLVRMRYSFQDKDYVYLAMEYLPGGDFRILLSNFASIAEDAARFYIAEMFTAVDALHKLGFIHRDLKPDNFLIDRSGHVKLTDFGLSKGGVDEHKRNSIYMAPGSLRALLKSSDNSKDKANSVAKSKGKGPDSKSQTLREIYRSRRKMAYSLVGSPDYMAPEMLEGVGYDHTVDWWALGCILYEMIGGYPPFTASRPEDVFANILRADTVLKMPEADEDVPAMSSECFDLIKKLLVSEPSERLGRGSFDEIKAHPFFKAVDWKNLRDTEPPFEPSLDSETDTSYFNASDLENADFDATIGESFDTAANEVQAYRREKASNSTPPLPPSPTSSKNDGTANRKSIPPLSSFVGKEASFNLAFAGFSFRRYGTLNANDLKKKSSSLSISAPAPSKGSSSSPSSSPSPPSPLGEEITEASLATLL